MYYWSDSLESHISAFPLSITDFNWNVPGICIGWILVPPFTHTIQQCRCVAISTETALRSCPLERYLVREAMKMLMVRFSIIRTVSMRPNGFASLSLPFVVCVRLPLFRRWTLENGKMPRQQSDVTSHIKTYSAANGRNVFGYSCFVTFARSLSFTLPSLFLFIFFFRFKILSHKRSGRTDSI